jgi:cellulose synthase/poly-beta-1,6-N-acetylglucosamine synthase-like glycosyltransferase
MILVGAKRQFAKSRSAESACLPEVTVIICAYNEAACIEAKIGNCLDLDYPCEKVRFLFVTDGSNDGTDQLVRHFNFPADIVWQLLHREARGGKLAAFQRGMEHVESEIVVSTDANTMLNSGALRALVAPFSDPAFGAVAGEKRIYMDGKASASGAGEGLYWKYESRLKRLDAALWTVVGAAGELFAFRRELFEAVPADTIVEDFYFTIRIAQRGFRVAYVPEAYAVESSSASVGEEWKRKVRIAAGGIQAMFRLLPLLNIFRHGVLSFQYLSHRVFRWAVAPLLLPILYLANLTLAKGSMWYLFLLVAQSVFYGLALLGWVFKGRRLRFKLLFIPYYFCLMNGAMYVGFYRYLTGGQSVIWEKSKRL